MDESINVSDIIAILEIEENDFTNIKSILDILPHINNYNINIQYFIILSSLIHIIKLDITGCIVELGCCYGQTTIRILKVLEFYNSNKSYHVYDSFKGLPEIKYELEKDNTFLFKKESMKYSINEFCNLLDNFNCYKYPSIHSGFFENINPDVFPDNISFAFFDSCLFESIKYSFKYIWTKLSENGIIVVNKFDDKQFFGVKDACLHFFNNINNDLETEYTYNIIYNNYYVLVLKKIKKKNIKII